MFRGRWHFACKMTEGAAFPTPLFFLNNRRGVLSTTATLLSLRDISPVRGIPRVSAHRTGTQHLIPNAFCVLNYTYVYRDKIAKPVNADYVSAGVQCTPLQLKTNVSIQLKGSPDVGGAFKVKQIYLLRYLTASVAATAPSAVAVTS